MTRTLAYIATILALSVIFIFGPRLLQGLVVTFAHLIGVS